MYQYTPQDLERILDLLVEAALIKNSAYEHAGNSNVPADVMTELLERATVQVREIQGRMEDLRGY